MQKYPPCLSAYLLGICLVYLCNSWFQHNTWICGKPWMGIWLLLWAGARQVLHGELSWERAPQGPNPSFQRPRVGTVCGLKAYWAIAPWTEQDPDQGKDPHTSKTQFIYLWYGPSCAHSAPSGEKLWRHKDPWIEWADSRCQTARVVAQRLWEAWMTLPSMKTRHHGAHGHGTLGPVDMETWKHLLPDWSPNSWSPCSILQFQGCSFCPFSFSLSEKIDIGIFFSKFAYLGTFFFSHWDKPAIPTAHTGGRALSTVCVSFWLPRGSLMKLTHFLWPLKQILNHIRE